MMKLSDSTIAVLKNFGNINSGIFLKKGKTLSTVSAHKNILAKATITDEISDEFGIYDLNEFLSVISLYKNDLDVQLQSKDLVISGLKGRSKTTYRTCDKTMIVSPPEKELQMPDPDISISLTETDFKWILDNANVLGSPQIAIQSDGFGEPVKIVTLDTANDASHTQSLELNVESTGKYRMIFKTENIQKVLSGPYDLKVSSKGIAHFKNTKFPIEYFITTEVGSTFEKAK
jgi:hypothetical protein